MTGITRIDGVAVHASRPSPTDPVFAEAEGSVGGQDCTVTLTLRGLYLAIDGGRRSFGIDLNALVRALGDAVEAHVERGAR